MNIFNLKVIELTIVNFTAGKDNKLTECLNFLDDYIKRPQVIGGFRLPLMRDSMVKQAFLDALSMGVREILMRLIAEIEAISDLKGKERIDYSDMWIEFLDWLKDLNNFGSRHAITYKDPTETNQVMFYKDVTGYVHVENVYTDTGDIVSKLLAAFAETNNTVQLGGE